MDRHTFFKKKFRTIFKVAKIYILALFKGIDLQRRSKDFREKLILCKVFAEPAAHSRPVWNWDKVLPHGGTLHMKVTQGHLRLEGWSCLNEDCSSLTYRHLYSLSCSYNCLAPYMSPTCLLMSKVIMHIKGWFWYCWNEVEWLCLHLYASGRGLKKWGISESETNVGGQTIAETVKFILWCQ